MVAINFTKAKFAGVGTFFTNKFPSLGIFIDKKVGMKGQVISKGFFGVFNFFQKTNEDKSTSRKKPICTFV